MSSLQSRISSLTLVFAFIAGLLVLSSRSAAQGAVVAAMPGPTGATGVFVPHPVAPVFGTSHSNFSSAMGDLDGDGDLDVVIGNAISSSTSAPATVWVSDGAGRFSPHPTRPTFGSQYANAVAMGDLDDDGDLDIILGNKTSAESVWLNDGTGRFSAHPTSPSFEAGPASEVVLGDVDDDGDLDAVVSASDANAETVWLNNGTGVFTAHPSVPQFGTTGNLALQLGDIDNDGDLDAVVGKVSNLRDEVWLNNGAGVFSPHPTTPLFGLLNTADTDIELGDIDGDGDLDAVVSTWDQSSPQGTRVDAPETVWLNDGLGNLTPHPTTPTFGSGVSQELAMGDLDGDGDLDVMVSNIHNQAETVWLNDGLGNFTAHPTRPSFGASDSEEIELGDLDGDGDLDALITAWSNHGTSVWMNRNASVLVQPTELLTTTESGATATFGMRLGFAPTSDVTISLATSDPTEGYLSANQVVFTPGTWAVTQTITVTGLDDGVLDGDIAYTITTSLASSSDPAYSGQDVADVRLINLDNEVAPTSTPTATATSMPTATATSMPTSTPTTGKSLAFLPLVIGYEPWRVAINEQRIATRPVVKNGEVYYTRAITIPAPLPAAGRFYLTAAPDQLAPVTVDDELVVLVGGAEQWASFLTYAKVVEVPRSLVQSWVGQPVTVQFRDAHGSVVGSSPVWLVWIP